MIKHVVMWRFKEGVSGEDKREMKRRLEALAGEVPSLAAIEVGLNLAKGDAAMDMVLCSGFNTLDDLQAYAIHPAHQRVVDFIKPLVCARAVADYEC